MRKLFEMIKSLKQLFDRFICSLGPADLAYLINDIALYTFNLNFNKIYISLIKPSSFICQFITSI